VALPSSFQVEAQPRRDVLDRQSEPTQGSTVVPCFCHATEGNVNVDVLGGPSGDGGDYSLSDLTGTLDTAIHPRLEFTGGLEFEAELAWDGSDFHVLVKGDMDFAGHHRDPSAHSKSTIARLAAR
jgi:hypothetical protein